MDNYAKLERFVEAQENTYSSALSEIKAGRKRTHWMWFIFPQLRGLGMSHMADLYGIRDLEEAKEYLKHPVLGERLKEISGELLKSAESDPHKIFGSPDDLKLRSSMTLFSEAEPDSVFIQVLEKFYKGAKDQKTLKLLYDK